MKRFSSVALCAIVFVAALVCVKPHSVLAQPQPVIAQEPLPREWRQIRVHDVRPDSMAYLIDPKHQKAPLEFTIPSLNDLSDSVKTESIDAMKAGASDLTFNGVLAADDTQNALWVYSNQQTFDQTKKLVSFLDHPIPQAELELQVVKINKEDLESFETQLIQPVLKNQSQHFPYKFSAITANARMPLQKALHELVEEGKAKILYSPRLTTLNHVTGSLSTATTTPISVGIKNLNTPYVPLTFDSKGDYAIGHTTQLRAAFTPDINEAAKTISVDLDISADEGLSKYNANPKDAFSNHDKTIWFRTQIDPPLVAKVTVADNQTIEITGLDSTMLGYDEKHDNVAIFMTAQIIHRSEAQ